MTFQSQADLAQDQNFQERVTACCIEQALIFKDDSRFAFYMLSRQYIQMPTSTVQMITLVSVAPNFKDTVDQDTIQDNDILASVQANWSVLGSILYPEPPEPVPLPVPEEQNA